MTPAEQALANTITFEAKKDSLRQSQSGDWKITFTIQGIDMDARLSKAAPGTRYVAVLVEINDHELPVAGAAAPAAGRSMARESERSRNPGGCHALTPNESHSLGKEASQDEPAPEKPRREWREIDPTTQAGIRCNEPTFAAYLKENFQDDWRESQDAAGCVRLICGVQSRKLLATDQRARVLWYQLDSQFAAWKALERV